jgi:proline-rich protein PRCC
MLGVEGYGSDDNDSGDEISVKPATTAKPTPRSSVTSSSSLSLPPPKTKKAPKKITIGLPTLSSNDGVEDEQDDQPPTKKPRLETGSGKSALFSMLPAPKQAAPLPKAAAAPERVLGGGRGPGLMFNAARSAPTPDAVSGHTEDEADESSFSEAPAPPPTAAGSSTVFMPSSLKKGRPNISLEEPRKTTPLPKASVPPAAPAVDFFSLGMKFNLISIVFILIH